MTQAKQRKRAPALIALALFAAVGALIVLTSQWRPQAWDLPPDPVEQRLDRENNAWFMLDEAGGLFQEHKSPPGITALTGWILEEPQEYAIVGRVWQRADSFLVTMPDQRTATDHTKLIEALHAYMKGLEPALDKACEAAKKPWCLDPVDPAQGREPAHKSPPRRGRGFSNDELIAVGYGSHPGAGVMAAALINSAVTMSREGRDDGKPCDYVRAWLSLTKFIGPGHDMAYKPMQWHFAAETLRRANAQQQDEMLKWLIEFRTQWKPPVHTLVELLRLMERKPLPIFPRPLEALSLLNEKRFLATHALECIRVAGMTVPEMRTYEMQHPEIRQARSLPPYYWVQFNSRALSGIDGLALMLAIEKYKRAHEEYPENLDALAPQYVPQEPTDSFNGKPFRYQRSADNYALYSGGEAIHPNSLSGATVFNAWPGYEF